MWRLAMGSGGWLLVLPLVMACGGVVEGGSNEPDDGTSKSAASGSSSGSKGGTDYPDADTDLGECKLGPLETDQTHPLCAWVANKRCYQAREMACNCACPRSRDSQCTSGFDEGPDGHVWVSCN
jgi:hypothetical protein